MWFKVSSCMGLVEHFRSLRDERRRLGWKGLLKQRGWKFVALVVVVYLVRDVVLYVLVPLAIVAGRALPAGAAYLQVFRFAGVTAFVAYSVAL